MSEVLVRQLQEALLPPILSSHQKYSTVLSLAKDLASLVSGVGMPCFKERLAFLQDMRHAVGHKEQLSACPVHVSSVHSEMLFVPELFIVFQLIFLHVHMM